MSQAGGHISSKDSLGRLVFTQMLGYPSLRFRAESLRFRGQDTEMFVNLNRAM